jgi:hypothetical protein
MAYRSGGELPDTALAYTPCGGFRGRSRLANPQVSTHPPPSDLYRFESCRGHFETAVQRQIPIRVSHLDRSCQAVPVAAQRVAVAAVDRRKDLAVERA